VLTKETSLAVLHILLQYGNLPSIFFRTKYSILLLFNKKEKKRKEQSIVFFLVIICISFGMRSDMVGYCSVPE